MAVVPLTDTRPANQPRLVAVQFLSGDPGSNAPVDLVSGFASSPDTYFAAATAYSLDTLIAAGWKDHAFMWYAGRGGTSDVGMLSLDYPTAGASAGLHITCDPLTESQYATIVGNRTLFSSFITALQTNAREGACYPFSFYSGSAPASSAIDNTTLDNFVTVPAAVSGYAGFDATSACDYDNNMALPSILGSHLKAWYSADTNVFSDAGVTAATNGQTIRQWNDRSGNSNHLSQSTSGARPTFIASGVNGLPIVRFNGTSNFMAMTSAVTLTDLTIIAVLKIASGSASRALFSSTTDDDLVDYNVGATGRARMYNPNEVLIDGMTPDGSFIVSTFQNTSNTGTGYKNGTQGTYPVSQNLTGGLTFDLVGYYRPFNDFFMSGDIAEIIVIDSSITANQRGLIHKYLATKYGLTVADTPTLPQRALVNRCPTSVGKKPICESWERRDVTGIQAWPPLASSMIASVSRVNFANANSISFYTKGTILSAGAKPIVFIQSSDGTAIEKMAMALDYGRHGITVWIDMAGVNPLSSAQIAKLKQSFDIVAKNFGSRRGRGRGRYA